MKPEEIECKHLRKIKMELGYRGENKALGKTRPDEYGYYCGHPQRLAKVRRACKPHQYDDPCPVTNSFEWPE